MECLFKHEKDYENTEYLGTAKISLEVALEK